MRLGIDARPLTAPTSGIGRYTAEILTHLADQPNLELYLYAHNSLQAIPGKPKQIRTGRVKRNLLSSIYAQTKFPYWAKLDHLEAFWSPRHHLPLALTIPTLLTIHDLVWQQQPLSMKPANRWLERTLMGPSVRKANKIIAVSHATKADLVNWQPTVEAKTSVIHEAPFTTATADRLLDPRSPYMLFVGTFEPRKNLERLLLAYKELVRLKPSTQPLILAGRIGWGNDISTTIRSLGLEEQVQVADNPSDVQLVNLYRHCDFLVMPSLYEGFGLPIVEAMSFGKPCVHSNLSSLPEVAGNAGIAVDPLDIEDIRGALDKLSNDRALHGQLSKNAVQQSLNFSWKHAAEQTQLLIESLAQKN